VNYFHFSVRTRPDNNCDGPAFQITSTYRQSFQMLLFGGNLAGVKPPVVGVRSGQSITSSSTSVNAQAREEAAPQTLTPHTDVLHRLTNHELRLLEELERTRSKLQAEWRVKLTELQRDEPEVAQTLLQRGPPTVDQLTQLFLVPKTMSRPESASHDCEVKSIMRTRTMAQTSSQRSKRFLPHKKVRIAVEPVAKSTSLNREPSLPRIRTNLDVLPILTTAAETAFEVGLAPPIASPQSQPQQHVLPIFRLPTVNVHATAAALTTKEVEAIEEDRERKQASETLGLSLEEIEMLEATLHGHTNPSPVGLATFGNSSRLPGFPVQRSSKGTVKDRVRPHINTYKKASSKTGRKQEHSGDLRKDLEAALHSVQHLTRLVKADIFSAQQICPTSHLRTSVSPYLDITR
jgi:hypothetical protein